MGIHPGEILRKIGDIGKCLLRGKVFHMLRRRVRLDGEWKRLPIVSRFLSAESTKTNLSDSYIQHTGVPTGSPCREIPQAFARTKTMNWRN